MHNTKTYLKNKNVLKTGLILSLLYGISLICGFSQETLEKDKIGSPYFLVLSKNTETDQLPLKSTQADVNIVGVIADVTVTQIYKNEGKNALEAVYTFPTSSNAAIYALEMKIGNRKIIAKIEEKNKARQAYNQAKTDGKRTSLLEQQRPNVFQMNVANIMPDDEIIVTLKYTEMLIPESNIYTFVYPTVAGPRYSGGSSLQAPENRYLSTPYQHSGEKPLCNFDINIHLSTGMPIQHVSSNSHEIKTSYPIASKANITLSQNENAGGNRDFVLNYQLSGKKIESGLLLYEHEDENFFLLMIQPPKKIVREEIPPREYVFIVDVSGSMRGFPMDVTKKLLRNLVVNLRPTDLFNVMVFAGTSGWMSDVSVPADENNIENAIQFIDNQRGSGSTQLLPAIKKALKFPRLNESISRSFIIVTDGYISIEKEVFELIRKNHDQANIFTFGIGSSVNRYLIEGMAHVGMGEPLIVLNEKEAHIEAEKFRNYISNPVLTQVKKEFSGFEVYDVEPLTVPDVLAERPVIVYGKYKGDPKGTITIKGKTGKNRYKKTFTVSETKPDKNNAAIRYLWARKKIQMLDDYNNLNFSEQTVQEVTNLGLKYNLMTAYTSFLAVDQEIANNGTIKKVKQPLPMPQGVPNSAIGFEMEIEEENFSFFFHKNLEILSDFSETIKKELILDIENKVITQLNAYLCNYLGYLKSVTLTINKSGNIIAIDIQGIYLNSEIKKELEECILNADYTSVIQECELKFKITF